MRKFLKNQKGFTLIELMMVIAVIGILAAVLIPKIGGTKDAAKLSGVDSNARIVQSQVEGLLERNKTDASKFQTALNNATSDLVNPFGSTTVRSVIANAATHTAVAGEIVIEVSPDVASTSTVTSVKITPYDNNTTTPVAMPSITVKP